MDLIKWKYHAVQKYGPKKLYGEYGSRSKRNPYKYVNPYEIEAEKWAQQEYRKFWKDKV